MIKVGQDNIKNVFFGSTSIKKGYSGEDIIFNKISTNTIQEKWINSGLADWTGSTGQAVKFKTGATSVPYVSDGYILTSTTDMFGDCWNLTSVTLFDTQNVTTMYDMFTGCYKLSSVPLFETSACTTMRSMFTGCYKLISVPLFNTENVTNMDFMFQGCDLLTTVPLFNTSSVTSMTGMFTGNDGITEVPLFDISACTSVYSMFSLCTSLISVPELNLLNCLPDITSAFYMCTSLTNCYLINLKPSINFNNSSNLTRDSIMFMINNSQTGTNRIMTLHATAKNRLTQEDINDANLKGWTFATAI
ncbi:hypothetical protein EZS27_004676 [termite gut metagenome]|uniref:Uncharacterized protein n=1 Tax=termite gut metagenome TaxID=433724 RepID=A0A5J4SPB2_9ZZZZ